MNLNLFMEQGIDRILNTVSRFYLNNPTGRSFLLRMLPAVKKSALLRKRHEEQGLHVPPFLIASIVSRCNLQCAGCYARAGGGCENAAGRQDMDVVQWRSVLSQAAGLGVSFILLAGGEPFLRRDILELATEFLDVIFPVFTNGTLLDEDMVQLLDRHRNLIPILSVEGDEEETDTRRGYGIYARVERTMDRLRECRILFGTSITVTNKNLKSVTEHSFISSLQQKGCGLTLFVEYVPAEDGTEHLVLSQSDYALLQERCAALKKRFDSMIVLSFPGDEQAMGGCLASGRGFFHINAQGGAEPCPFSPYAKLNVRDTSIVEILQSDYFSRLRTLASNAGHQSGCTLFDQREQVESLMALH